MQGVDHTDTLSKWTDFNLPEAIGLLVVWPDCLHLSFVVRSIRVVDRVRHLDGLPQFNRPGDDQKRQLLIWR